MKYKIDWLKYLLIKLRSYKRTWKYVFENLSLYEVAYEIRREAKYCIFYRFLDLIFVGKIYIIDYYEHLLTNLFLSGCLEVVK